MERYGLFKRLASGAPMWVCAANDLAKAKDTIQNLSEQTGLEYFIHDFRSGTLVASSRQTEISEVEPPGLLEGI
jgi:hypothetical protein